MRMWRCTLLLALAPLGACSSQTLLLATFQNDAFNAPPTTQQDVGTVRVDSGSGSVFVTAAPNGDSTNKWVILKHYTVGGNPTAVQGFFADRKGTGTYSVTAEMFINPNQGPITVQFEPYFDGVKDYANFLHIDFLRNDSVRVNDDPTKEFGPWPVDDFFDLIVTLHVGDSVTTASFVIRGKQHSASFDYTLDPASSNIARDFGAVRFWIPPQSAGAVAVDDIVVTWH